MGEVVADKLQRVRLVLRRHQRERRVGLERPPEVAQLAIDARGERGLQQPGADACGDIGGGRSCRNPPPRAIGKRGGERFGHKYSRLYVCVQKYARHLGTAGQTVKGKQHHNLHILITATASTSPTPTAAPTTHTPYY